jgi:MFS family permease
VAVQSESGTNAPDRRIDHRPFNRWWIIPASLGINLSIGQVSAFSVFNLPLTRVIGIGTSAPGDWTLAHLGWIFTIAYIFLGLSAGVAGRWQERVGPRTSGIVAAMCFSGGFVLSAIGIFRHEIGLLYIGYGVIGGCGLGIGFNTPTSALIRWFPDRRGLAMGMAIMGFGGGAIIAAPLSQALMARFASSSSVGVGETFLALAAIYFVMMTSGALVFRLPPADWGPPHAAVGQRAAVPAPSSMSVRDAVRTREFALLWSVLLVNVTAGIAVLGQAAPMIQEIFSGLSASTAAVFVALLGFFNMGGRLLWASVSDVIGPRTTYGLFLGVGCVAYATVPYVSRNGNLVLFIMCLSVIMTMYGGGFSTMPPYIADVFGSAHVAAINGWVLTALSAAGVLGPVSMNYLRQWEIANGTGAARAYDLTLFIMAALLGLGFLCNLAIRRRRMSAP